MRRSRGRVVVLSNNSGSLFGYADTLNKLGYYTLSLCSHVNDVVELLETGRRFEFMVYDALNPDTDAHSLQMIASYRAITSIISISDVNSRQRQDLIMWARTHQVPLQGVLQAPLRSPELYQLLACFRAMAMNDGVAGV